MYVAQFHDQLRKGLRLFHEGPEIGKKKRREKAQMRHKNNEETDDEDHNEGRFNVIDSLRKGKIVITPYGGRLEYNIAGTKLIVHLKDADKVQRGKRWSQGTEFDFGSILEKFPTVVFELFSKSCTSTI